ncbi:Bug family tripartite tricarboxylate transporter substrate binding protein [Ramlibacter sp.]|uniref:Bug family tripartite tricarboxylate transporter substrate binding protein n=1 Tax=Ramlibacter sp. TaxID=1917967 RepID=UPI0035AE806C
MNRIAATRRSLALAGLVTALALALPATTLAQGAERWPDKPIRLIVLGTPGASADVLARTIGDGLSRNVGQPVVVDPKPGAAGALAVEALLAAPRDGHTYLVAVNSLVSEIPHSVKPRHDPFKDLVPLVELVSGPLVLVANTQTGVGSLKEMAAYVKARPGKVSYASYSAGTLSHVMGLQLNKAAGLDMQHVGYKGSSPALQDLIGGQVDFMFDGSATSIPHIKAGKLKALAVTSARRISALPEVPTMTELGYPQLTQYPWIALWSTPGTPAAAQARMRAEVLKVLATPQVRDKFTSFGLEVDPTPPTVEQMQQTLRTEFQAVGQTLSSIGYKPE